MSATLIASEAPKGREILRNCAVGLDQVVTAGDVDEQGLQVAVERAAELQAGTAELVRRLALPRDYEDQEVPSNYGYLSGYRKPVEVADQIDILRTHWPSLNPDAALKYYHDAYPKLQLPGWVEGPFAVIRPGFFSDQYGEELTEVFKALVKDRGGKFTNYLGKNLGPAYPHQSERTLEKLRQICEAQNGSDILVVPAQSGIRHRGRSVLRARVVFLTKEYGQGGKDTGTMLLTNPVRLQHYDDLWIDCPGDEYAPDAVGGFSDAPFFNFNSGELRFDAGWVASPHEFCGSASAFAPQ